VAESGPARRRLAPRGPVEILLFLAADPTEHDPDAAFGGRAETDESCYNLYIVIDRKFLEAVSLAEGPTRTAALAALLQSLDDTAQQKPVLVGGGAVELYSGGSYTTGDLDFVGSLPVEAERHLRKVGFRRQGRHWIHEEHRIFLEFPSDQLAAGERAGVIEVDGYSVVVIGLEECGAVSRRSGRVAPGGSGGGAVKSYRSPPPQAPLRISSRLRRRRPRSYLEWKTLRRWGSLSPWEEMPAGYLLRSAREEARVTQQEMADRLDCSQQAIAQAERWSSNPTVRFLRRWADALGRELRISIES
jgi:DNA-binding XRE family transcriptional regulator